MVRRKMSRANRFKQSLKTKQGKGILLIAAVAVLFLFGSTAFSAFNLSKVVVGVSPKMVTSVGSGGTVDEGAMAVDGHHLYFMMYGYRVIADDPVGVPTALDGSDCKLVCTENDVVVGVGILGKSVVFVHIPDESFWEITPYFEIDVSGVYKDAHNYKLVVSGSVIGESVTFIIIGDATSPDYPDDNGDGNGDGNGDDNGDDNETIPELPTFTAKPPDAVDMFANETRTFFWNVSDDNPSHYALYQNGTLVQTGLVLTEVFSYPMTVANFTDGVHSFTFEYEDVDGNTISHTMILTVSGGFGWENWIDENPMMVIVILIGAVVLFGGGGGTYVKHSRR